MDACARHAEMVGLGLQYARDHLGVLAFTAGRRAVFAIAGHVEYRPQLLHDFQGFQDQLLTAGEMFAGGNYRERLLAGEQGGIGMNRVGHLVS